MNKFEKEIESRLKNFEWDSKIANLVINKVEKKEKIKNTIIAAIAVGILSISGVYFIFEVQPTDSLQSISNLYNTNDLYSEELEDFIGFLED